MVTTKVGRPLKCRKHPKYQGKREPLVDCDGCYDLWNYPRLCDLGVKVGREEGIGEYVSSVDLCKALGPKYQKFLGVFGEGHTVSGKGAYPWEVEYALRRMGL